MSQECNRTLTGVSGTQQNLDRGVTFDRTLTEVGFGKSLTGLTFDWILTGVTFDRKVTGVPI